MPRAQGRGKTPIGPYPVHTKPTTPCQLAWTNFEVRREVETWLETCRTETALVVLVRDRHGIRDAVFKRAQRIYRDYTVTSAVDSLTGEVFASRQVETIGG